jgi:Ca2+/Na+ antiporter
MRDFLNKLVISVLVVIFMAAFSLLFPQPKFLHFVALLFVVLLFYYLGLPALSKFVSYLRAKKKKRFPKLGVLNGNIDSPVREYKCQHGNTDVTAGMWFTELRREFGSKKVEMITTSQISGAFSIIVNPFGDIFPEEDLKLHTTFYRICRFIEEGGFFLCTGGAFWAHQNTKVSEKEEWVFVRSQEGVQSLKDSFLYKEFGIVVTGEVINSNGKFVVKEPLEIQVYQKKEDEAYIGPLIEANAKIRRFRALMPESSNYIPLLREKDDKSFPLAAVQYGKGYLLHAGMRLTGTKIMEFDILIKAMKDIVKNKFSNF